MQHLIIRTGKHDLAFRAEWALFDDEEKLSSGGPVLLSEIAAHLPRAPSGGRDVCVLVQATEALLTRAEIPPGQRRHVKAILPFLVEEQVAEDSAAMHFAAASLSDEPNTLNIAAVRKSMVQSLLEELRAVGLFPRLVMPETLALPYTAGNVSLLCDGPMAWLRTGPYQGAGSEWNMLPDMLALLREENATPLPLTCYVPEALGKGEAAKKLLESLKRSYPQAAIQLQSVASVMDTMSAECLSLMQSNTALNLLQGEFAPNAQSHFQKALWKVGWIAAAWFLLQVGMDMAQSAYFSYRAEQSRAEMAALYRQLFPSDSRIIDPTRQMKAHLSAVTGESEGVLHILQQLAARWSPADNALLQMKSIAYRDDERLLTLSIEAKSMEALNQLMRRVDGNGLSAGITSVVNGENGVKGQLSVREAE